MGQVEVLGVSAEGQLEAKSLQLNKTTQNTLTNNNTPPRTWPSSSTSFYNTLLNLLMANYSFVSHSLVVPGTRRVLAYENNTPKTSVKMSSDVSILNNINPQFVNNLIALGHGWHLALGLCSTQAAPLCCAMQVFGCVQGAQHRGPAAYQARASPVRPQAYIPAAIAQPNSTYPTVPKLCCNYNCMQTKTSKPIPCTSYQ